MPRRSLLRKQKRWVVNKKEFSLIVANYYSRTVVLWRDKRVTDRRDRRTTRWKRTVYYPGVGRSPHGVSITDVWLCKVCRRRNGNKPIAVILWPVKLNLFESSQSNGVVGYNGNRSISGDRERRSTFYNAHTQAIVKCRERKNAFRYYRNLNVYAYYCAILLRVVSPFIVSLWIRLWENNDRN